jgi:hypothetical protein
LAIIEKTAIFTEWQNLPAVAGHGVALPQIEGLRSSVIWPAVQTGAYPPTQNGIKIYQRSNMYPEIADIFSLNFSPLNFGPLPKKLSNLSLNTLLGSL